MSGWPDERFAEVTEAEFANTRVGALLLFHVVAEYDSRSGHHVVHERMLTGIADAPTVGGTVLLRVAADGSDPTNVLIERDPDSIRHPDPSVFDPAYDPRIRGWNLEG